MAGTVGTAPLKNNPTELGPSPELFFRSNFNPKLFAIVAYPRPSPSVPTMVEVFACTMNVKPSADFAVAFKKRNWNSVAKTLTGILIFVKALVFSLTSPCVICRSLPTMDAPWFSARPEAEAKPLP